LEATLVNGQPLTGLALSAPSGEDRSGVAAVLDAKVGCVV
jgi:hypothetical protein